MSNTRIAVGVGALALLIGGLGPWATALGIVSISATQNAEVAAVVFGGAAISAVAAITGRSLRGTSITVGVLALSEAVYRLVSIENAKSQAGEFGGLISPGWGLYLTIVATVFLIASTFLVSGQDGSTSLVGPNPPSPEDKAAAEARREVIYTELHALDLEDRDPERRAELRRELVQIGKLLAGTTPASVEA
jgi:hypothetical protein